MHLIGRRTQIWALSTLAMILLILHLTVVPTIQVAHSKEHKKPDGKPDMSSHSKHEDVTGKHDENFDHESITGSKHEAEEFAQMKPEEAKKKLKIFCTKMDLDKSGDITKEELKKWILASFAKLDTENTKEKMEEQDKNKDNMISFNEHILSEYGYTPQEWKKMINDTKDPENANFAKMIKDDQQKFELADVNKDGLLNLIELTAFIHTTNFPHMAPYEIDRALEDFDKNKNGLIDESEYLGEIDSYDKESLEKEKADFKSYDKNGDGSLNKEEITLWIMPGYEKPASEEVEHLFKETDKDKNGKLSYDEITDQHELWVGSQATDYGAHLKDEL